MSGRPGGPRRTCKWLIRRLAGSTLRVIILRKKLAQATLRDQALQALI
jgi:hypothetical protein